MMDPARVLQPLREAEAAIRRLEDYGSAAELAAALRETWRAVERSLRLLLRSDVRVPDSVRLGALSPAEFPLDRLLEALRRQNLISLELAGLVHQLARAAERAERGEVQAADGDLARRVVDRLEREVRTPPGESPIREVAHGAVEEGVLEEPAREVAPPRPRVRPLTLIAAGVALLAFVSLVAVLLISLDSERREAIEAFDAGQLDVAEARFRAIVRDSPGDVTARLYLGRIYRRQQRYQLAAQELQAAAHLDPNDPDVRRELGNLFMDLKAPAVAARHYRRAVELDPENERNWIGLVRALRAAGDPEEAEQVLRRAPPAARAALAE